MTKQYATAEYQRARRAAETPEQREARLTRERERAAERRPKEKKKPGRKPLPGSKPTPQSIYLTAEQITKAKRLGNGIISAGVRIAIDKAKEPTK